ncbi:MAG TPA: nucleoside hydrolase [Candidatus Acidoferrum sp.]|nr:nucleoside hydrolase [Candidatus Acidoferrum sp.]
MRFLRLWCVIAVGLLLACPKCMGQEKQKIIIDQDGAGPAGTDQQSILLLVQSPHTDVLGVTIVTGDAWLDEEVAHTLRTLEIVGRSDIPVVPGAGNPLVRQREETLLWEQRYGKITWLGAWTPSVYHAPDFVGNLPEGNPTTKPLDEDAAHFLVRMVRKYPNQVTIYEGGPMTNLALAISLDPEFPSLAKELVFMGGSLNPQTDDPEFTNNPRHEFNLWFDPEASHIVLRANWKKIVCTPVDISVKARLTQGLIDQIRKSSTPTARYIGQFAKVYTYDYMWDELAAAAWLDPSIITKTETRFMDVDIDRGAGYGNVLTWNPSDKPEIAVRPVEIQLDLDTAKLDKLFVDLLSAPTPPKTAP